MYKKNTNPSKISRRLKMSVWIVNMKKLKLSFLFSVFVILPACSIFESDIKEINSINEATSIFECASQDDLFVFDVDQVILEPEEPAMQARFHNNKELRKIKDDFFEFMESKKSPEEKDLFFSKLSLKAKIGPVEQLLIDKILALQKRKIRVIALTALNTGKFGLIDRLEDWRYNQLLSLGIDLESSFEQEEIVIGDLQDSDSVVKKTEFITKTGSNPGSAVFYRGIICSSCYDKGLVLRNFIEKTSYRPSQIYFFDDRAKIVEAVVQEMKKMGIKCQGFVYKAAAVKQPTENLDIKVVRLQHELMKQREDYVSYFEAKKILEQRKISNNNKLKPTFGISQ